MRSEWKCFAVVVVRGATACGARGVASGGRSLLMVMSQAQKDTGEKMKFLQPVSVAIGICKGINIYKLVTFYNLQFTKFTRMVTIISATASHILYTCLRMTVTSSSISRQE
jgi:hypothetical protein